MAIKTHIVGKFVVEGVTFGELADMTLTVNVNTGDTSKIGHGVGVGG